MAEIARLPEGRCPFYCRLTVERDSSAGREHTPRLYLHVLA